MYLTQRVDDGAGWAAVHAPAKQALLVRLGRGGQQEQRGCSSGSTQGARCAVKVAGSDDMAVGGMAHMRSQAANQL
jgi:hypothetical protein